MKSRKHLIYTALSTFTALTVTVSMIPVALAANSTKTASTAAAVTVTVPKSVDATYVMSEENNQVKITESGVYKITGSCSDGNIVVKKGTTGVTLILEDLTLTSTTGATLACNKSSEVTVYVVGSVSLTDAEDPADENSTDETVADAYDGAAIKAKAGSILTITGTGTLNVNGNAKNGIKGSDADTDLAAALITVEGAKLNITAANDGINASGDLTLAGGTITVSAGDDGIHSDATLTVDGADITILKSSEGLEGADIVLNSGSAKITASDDGINAAADGTAASLTVNGGYWYVNAGGDGLDAGGDSNGDNGAIVLNGGIVEVYGSANNGNGALDAGRGITYNGGTILAVGMSGMAEAPSGGSVVIFGSAGQMGGMMGQGGQMGGQMGQQNQTAQNGNNSMQMPQMGGNGGFGGMQNGPQGGMNGGFGGNQTGTFRANSIQNAAFGGMQGGSGFGGMQNGSRGGMNDAFGGQQNSSFGPQQGNEQNAQNSPFGQQNQMQQSTGSVSLSAGDAIVIKDASGNTLYSATAVKSANSVIFASDSVTSGSEYTLYVNGSAVATATAGTGAQGGMQMMQQPQNQQNTQSPQLGQQPQTNEPFGNQQNGVFGGSPFGSQPQMGGMMRQGPQMGGQFGGMQNGPQMGGMNNIFRMMR